MRFKYLVVFIALKLAEIRLAENLAILEKSAHFFQNPDKRGRINP